MRMYGVCKQKNRGQFSDSVENNHPDPSQREYLTTLGTPYSVLSIPYDPTPNTYSATRVLARIRSSSCKFGEHHKSARRSTEYLRRMGKVDSILRLLFLLPAPRAATRGPSLLAVSAGNAFQ